MKRLLLITLIIASAQIAGAQKIRFTDTSNVWSEYLSLYNDGMGGSLFETYKYMEDVTIDSVDYKKFDFGQYFLGHSLIREDTIANKVYIRDEYNDSDVVLMDYDLVVGDTFDITFTDAFNYHRYAVIGLDSTLINATWHKVWTFSENLVGWYPWFKSIVIEGVGCIKHPLYMLSYVNAVEPPYYYMYCFSNNGTTPIVSPGQPYLYWGTRVFDNSASCTEIPLLNIDGLQYSPRVVQLSPNPSSTSITIKSPGNITSLTISNMIGQVVYSQKYNSKEVQVDIAALVRGVYLVRVNDTEVIKLVKE